MHELAALVFVEAGFVGGDHHAGEVFELAVVQAEGPVVPGADGAAVFDVAADVLAVVEAGTDAPGGATRSTCPTFTCLLSGSAFHLARSAGFCLKVREMA